MSDEDLIEQLTQVIFDANAAPWPHPQTIPAARYAGAIVEFLSSSGRLLPPGSEVREEIGVRLRYDDDWIDDEATEPLPKPRALAEARVAFHRRKIEEVPGWRVRAAELISRRVITTPWSVPDTEPEKP